MRVGFARAGLTACDCGRKLFRENLPAEIGDFAGVGGCGLFQRALPCHCPDAVRGWDSLDGDKLYLILMKRCVG